MNFKKCKHQACNCTAPEGKVYCSQVCQDSKDITELVCRCGHPGCADALPPSKLS